MPVTGKQRVRKITIRTSYIVCEAMRKYKDRLSVEYKVGALAKVSLELLSHSCELVWEQSKRTVPILFGKMVTGGHAQVTIIAWMF